MSKFATFAREFIRNRTFGILSTWLENDSGYPFGSIVTFDIFEGSVIIFIAKISEHYRNLVKHPQASLLVFDSLKEEDIQNCPRATLLLDFKEIAHAEYNSVKDSYLKRFPDGIHKEIESGFTFFRGECSKVRWIGGFGQVGWISEVEL